MLMISTSPPSGSETAEDLQKNEGFLKSVWHRLTDHKNNGSSQTGSKDAKDTGNAEKDDASKDDSKKSK